MRETRGWRLWRPLWRPLLLMLVLLLPIASMAVAGGKTNPPLPVVNRDLYGRHVLIVDQHAAQRTGYIYTTVQAAIDKAVSQTPTAADPWLIVIRPGIYTENVICAAYVDMLGQGTVEIQRSGDNSVALTLASNIRLRNLTARSTAGANVSAAEAIADVEGLEVRDCRFIVDAGCTGTTDALDNGGNRSIAGSFYDCYWEGNWDAARLGVAANKILRLFNCVGYANAVAGPTDVSGLYVCSGAGVLEAYNCRFEAQVTGALTVQAAPLHVETSFTGIAKFFNCDVVGSGASTGGVYGPSVAAGGADAFTLELYGCRIKVSSASTGEVRGVWSAGVNTVLTMVGGSITASGSGNVYTAKRITGSLTLKDVTESGPYSGTVGVTMSHLGAYGYLLPICPSYDNSAFTLTPAYRAWATPVRPDRDETISKIAVAVTTAATNVKVAIYSDSSGPTNLLAYSNSTALTPANAKLEIALTSSYTLTAGTLYWFAIMSDGTTGVVRGQLDAWGKGGTYAGQYWTNAGSFTWDNPRTAALTASQTPVMLGLIASVP